MFREIRRKDRALSDAETEALLASHNYGVLCVSGNGDYPYGVPVNYGYADGKIYIHGTSQSSHKLDCIRQDSRVCFTVVGEHELAAAEFSNNYSSAIVFGRARILTEEADILPALTRMMSSLAPEMADQAADHCRGTLRSLVMLEITPEHISGKARRK